MKHPKDSGASPEARYTLCEKKNAIRLTSSDTIRMFADYNKVKPVRRGKIHIQEMNELLFFKITDSEWFHKLNNQHVRVRMISRDVSFIYLFDMKTDTYLTFVERELETAGTAANATAEDWKRIQEHVKINQQHQNFREEKYEDALNHIEETEKNIPVLPASLSESNGIILPGETPDRENWVDSNSEHTGKKASKPTRAKGRREKAAEIDSSKSDLNADELSSCEKTAMNSDEAVELPPAVSPPVEQEPADLELTEISD